MGRGGMTGDHSTFGHEGSGEWHEENVVALTAVVGARRVRSSAGLIAHDTGFDRSLVSAKFPTIHHLCFAFCVLRFGIEERESLCLRSLCAVVSVRSCV